MSDPWVTNTQNWLNSTYNGVIPGWENVTVDGSSGWETVHALIHALQWELGITSVSDNFGDGTFAAVDDISPIGNTQPNKNIIRIIQGGLYCKGYNGGDGELDGVYSSLTYAAVSKLRTDMGLSASTGEMTPKVFKALLNMDAFVLVDGGSAQIRAIQRDLNARYVARQDFYVVPADGLYSRAVQNALMLAIQYEIGMADGVANGNFGPGTQAGIQAQAMLSQGSTDATKYFVHLFQAALTFNGYATSYDGVFGSGTKSQTQNFQGFCKLTVNGNADFETWASLLVSTGDVNRPGTAADCITTITTARAQTLYNNGYRIIGRYLTNTPVADPLDKNIKPGELATIFANNLRVFPIFQEGGTDLSYFSQAKGLSGGQRAYDAAVGYGFKRGTVIYFAVDFDVVEHEVYDYIVPYFQGINKAISDRGDVYRIGIYASRNTCSIISDQGLAELSFVSGMSTGYSGNLGFPLPRNWAFDQILEYTIGSGAGEIGIDKDIASGLDAGQASVESAVSGLDVVLPASVRAAWSSDVAGWLTAHMNPLQQAGAIRNRGQVTQLGLDHDTLITNLARGYRMRKSFIQTVQLWESAVEDVRDVAKDVIVQATYAYLFAGGPQPPVMEYDCSTGICQIFAKTAIEAINWGRDRGLTTQPSRSLSSQMDMWIIWQQLHNDEEFNLTMAALVLLKAAADKGVTNVLNPSAADVQATLGKYNGEPQYGIDNYGLYQLLEGYNSAARA